NVEYGLKVKGGYTRDERRRRALEALAMVRLEGYGDRRPSQLSGGQRPLGALDLKLRQELQIELKQIQEDLGMTFIYVTHDQEEALTMSDRIAVFNEGRVEQVGSPVDVYEQPASEFVAG